VQVLAEVQRLKEECRKMVALLAQEIEEEALSENRWVHRGTFLTKLFQFYVEEVLFSTIRPWMMSPGPFLTSFVSKLYMRRHSR
jgi:hypothetical protein